MFNIFKKKKKKETTNITLCHCEDCKEDWECDADCKLEKDENLTKDVSSMNKIVFKELIDKHPEYKSRFLYDNKLIYFGEETIVVKPYLSYSEKEVIANSCLRQFLLDNDTLDKNKIVEVKAYYDILVVQTCSNIDLTENTLDEIYSNTLIEDIIELVKNYNELWDLILNMLNHRIILGSLGLFGDALPTDEKIEATTKYIQSTLNELEKNNPELLRFIIANKLEGISVEQAKEQFKELKETTKNNVLETKNKNIVEEIIEDVDAQIEGR